MSGNHRKAAIYPNFNSQITTKSLFSFRYFKNSDLETIQFPQRRRSFAFAELPSLAEADIYNKNASPFKQIQKGLAKLIK